MPPPARAELRLGTPVSLLEAVGVPGWVAGGCPPPQPPRSYFGYSQFPAKAQEALKEDEREVEVEEDGGKESLFELTHEALGEREDEQELWKGQKNRQTDRQRETVSRSRSWGPGAAARDRGGDMRGHRPPPALGGCGEGDGGRDGLRTSVCLSIRVMSGGGSGWPRRPHHSPSPPSAAPCL